MNVLMKFVLYAVVTAGGGIAGLIVGYGIGAAVYFLAIVPGAEGMHPGQKDSYLCSAGDGLAWLGILAGFIGGAILSPLALAWKTATMSRVDKDEVQEHAC